MEISPSDGPAPPRPNLSLLRRPDFRWLSANMLLASIGMMGEVVVLGWLALELTDSPFLVGLAMGARALPLFFVGVPAGVLADRWPRHRLLMLTGAGQGLTAAALGILFQLGALALAAAPRPHAGLGRAPRRRARNAAELCPRRRRRGRVGEGPRRARPRHARRLARRLARRGRPHRRARVGQRVSRRGRRLSRERGRPAARLGAAARGRAGSRLDLAERRPIRHPRAPGSACCSP